MEVINMVSRCGIMKPPNKDITNKEKRLQDAATDGCRNTEAIKRINDIDTWCKTNRRRICWTNLYGQVYLTSVLGEKKMAVYLFKQN